jgi:hypothetical protein
MPGVECHDCSRPDEAIGDEPAVCARLRDAANHSQPG